MSEQPTDDKRRRRRDLDDIFGDVLPETTSDERDQPKGDDDREEWYRLNRPPHHD